MNIDDYYQEIARVALEVPGTDYDPKKTILIYDEIADGFIASSLFYESWDGRVVFKKSPQKLKNIIYRFWDEWREIPGHREWRCIEYVIQDGKFSIEFTYPDQIDLKKAVHTRRPAVIARHFGSIEVDYNNL